MRYHSWIELIFFLGKKTYMGHRSTQPGPNNILGGLGLPLLGYINSEARSHIVITNEGTSRKIHTMMFHIVGEVLVLSGKKERCISMIHSCDIRPRLLDAFVLHRSNIAEVLRTQR
jgi:hypothetical protein